MSVLAQIERRWLTPLELGLLGALVLFTALFAHFLYGQRIDASRAAGLVCGFVGIVVLAGALILTGVALGQRR